MTATMLRRGPDQAGSTGEIIDDEADSVTACDDTTGDGARRGSGERPFESVSSHTGPRPGKLTGATPGTPSARFSSSESSRAS